LFGNRLKKGTQYTHVGPLTAQSSKYTAGAITVAEAITMDGVEAIITVGAIITIGENIAAVGGACSGRGRLNWRPFYDG
jgi:hypothetical protein